MSNTHTLTLSGCAPIPLAHYLKALGVLRLVSEQKDPKATGHWHHDQFFLTSTLDRKSLLEFLTGEYQPTPIVAPWNGGSGFYEGDDQQAVEAIRQSTAARFGPLKKAIELIFTWAQLGPTKQSLAAMEETLRAVAAQSEGKAAKEIKDLIDDLNSSLKIYVSATGEDEQKLRGLHIEQIDALESGTSKRALSALVKSAKKLRTAFKKCHRASGKEAIVQISRSCLSDEAVSSVDAMVPILSEGTVAYPPLFGSGGTDGRLEFTNTFQQCLCEVIQTSDGAAAVHSTTWLKTALFQETSAGPLSAAPIGQFFPGAAGGANNKSGFNGGSITNPWDYILMMEGGLLFTGAAVKKLADSGDTQMVCPFCVSHSGAGFTTATRNDEAKSGCEIWVPLWKRPVSFPELQAVFGEGRVMVNGAHARNGVDFARATCSLGVDRGITSFHRYALLERNGQSCFATPLGKFSVQSNGLVDLVTDIEKWSLRLRFKTSPDAKPKAPSAIRQAFAEVERSIIEACHEASKSTMTSLLVKLGRAERSLARSVTWSKSKDKFQRSNSEPLYGLRPEWLSNLEDSCEFRLAASLASMRTRLGQGDGKVTFWLRNQLEPIDLVGDSRVWLSWLKNPSNDVTWHDGDLIDSLNAIMARRIQRVEKTGCEGWPDWSPCYARLDDITDFIEGRIDPALLADLIWGLSLIDWQAARDSLPGNGERKQGSEAIPSAFYALLKLCFRYKDKESDAIPIVPAIHQLARSGKGKEASRLAARRLRASGEAPLVTDLPVAADVARRTAAALLFPISPSDIKLLKLTLQHQTEEQTA